MRKFFEESKLIRHPTYVAAAQQTHELVKSGGSGVLRPISQPDPSKTNSLPQQVKATYKHRKVLVSSHEPS